jgi:hypothetical protein
MWKITAKHYKWIVNKANGHKIYQMGIKDMKYFNSKALRNLPKLGFLV